MLPTKATRPALEVMTVDYVLIDVTDIWEGTSVGIHLIESERWRYCPSPRVSAILAEPSHSAQAKLFRSALGSLHFKRRISLEIGASTRSTKRCADHSFGPILRVKYLSVIEDEVHHESSHWRSRPPGDMCISRWEQFKPSVRPNIRKQFHTSTALAERESRQKHQSAEELSARDN